MKNVLEILAGIGFFATGTDAIAITTLNAMPAQNRELLQIFFIGIGLLLLGHVGYNFWKENYSNKV